MQHRAGSLTFGLMTSLSALAALALTSTTSACGPGFDFDEGVVRTGTVSLDAQQVLVVDTATDLLVRASRRSGDVTWTFEGTVSATSADAARDLAQTVDIEVDDAESEQLVLTLPPVDNAELEGTWTVTAPSDLRIEVIGRGPAVVLEGFEGDISVDAALAVGILDSTGNIRVVSNTGEVVIDSDLPAGQTIEVETGAAIQLAIPLLFSAQIVAQAGPSGEISIQHPNLPPWPGGGQPYVVSAGGALASVQLVSRAGSVFITPPL